MTTDPTNGADILEVSGFTFRRLSPCDWVKLANRITTTRREQLRANIAAVNLEPALAVKLLNEFDSRPTTRGDVIDHAFAPEGVESVLLNAIQQVKPDATAADVAGVRIAQDELSNTIMFLMGLKPKIEEKKPGDGPLPAAVGASESPTGIGTMKPM